MDVRRWDREGFLRPGFRFGWQWSCNGEVTGSICAEAEEGRVILDYRVREDNEWEPMRYAVSLATTTCNLGGERKWFICPALRCGRRVALLYGGRIFACRHCHDLTDPSQREDASDRAARRAERIRTRLGWPPGALNGHGPKPKGMHWQTFDELGHRLISAQPDACGGEFDEGE
ncbi:hypothetical protein, partial [Acidimangrovimonas pyrenivorans]